MCVRYARMTILSSHLERHGAVAIGVCVVSTSSEQHQWSSNIALCPHACVFGVCVALCRAFGRMRFRWLYTLLSRIHIKLRMFTTLHHSTWAACGVLCGVCYTLGAFVVRKRAVQQSFQLSAVFFSQKYLNGHSKQKQLFSTLCSCCCFRLPLCCLKQRESIFNHDRSLD